MCMHVIWDDAGTTSYVLRAMYTQASLDHESAPLVDRTKTPCRQRDVVQLEPLAELLTRGSELTSVAALRSKTACRPTAGTRVGVPGGEEDLGTELQNRLTQFI